MGYHGDNSVEVWCRWHTNGGADIDDSYQVSSVSDNNTGYSYVNFSANFENSQYSVVSTGQEDSGGGGRVVNPRTPDTNRCQFETRNMSNSTRDFIDIHCIICGDHY